MTGLEEAPGVRNSPAKTPCFPRFSHLYSQSLLLLLSPLLHHTSPPLSSPSPFFPTSVLSLLCPSVHLLSSCIAPPALWCSTYNQDCAHERTHLQRHTHTHKRRETHAHHFRQPPSLSHTSLLQTRNTLQPLVCQCLIGRRYQHYIKTGF